MELKSALAQAQKATHAQTTLFFSEYLPHLAGVDPILAKVGNRLQEFCLRPGKAVRPLMVACGFALSAVVSLEEAFTDTRVQKLMFSAELIHKRLLMADDVADRDELRHDRPAFHALWEQDLAREPKYKKLSPTFRRHIVRSYVEIAGIWLQRMSEQAIEGTFAPAESTRINRIILEYVYEKTPAGWYLLFDQNFDDLESATEDVLLKGLEMVTGAYSFQGPLLMGSVLGSKSAELEKPLTEFGAAIGVLHQLTDDVIGLFGDPEVTGKPVGGDIREGKKTLLVQYAYRLGDGRDREQLKKLVGNQDISPADVETMREIVRRTGAFDQNQEKIQQYVDYGQASLEHLPDGEVRSLLQSLLLYLSQRQY